MFEQVLLILMAVLAGSLILAAVRLARGPTLADRVLALDLVLLHGVGLVALSAILTGNPALLDSLIGIAVAGFIGTLVLALALERWGRGR